MTQIGFVGLGKMGGNMAHRIRRDSDHEVVGYALDRTEIGHQLGRGREVVGHGLDKFGILLDALGHGRRHADVAFCARRLRERAVRDVAHRV